MKCLFKSLSLLCEGLASLQGCASVSSEILRLNPVLTLKQPEGLPLQVTGDFKGWGESWAAPQFIALPTEVISDKFLAFRFCPVP